MLDLHAIIQRFPPISLKEMDDVALQDRVDTKYLFPEGQLVPVLEALLAHYRILEVNGKRGTDYRSVYYDTPDLESYLDHHNGRVLRNKTRFREYIGSDLCFLEVKRKTGRGRTDKVRIRVPTMDKGMDNDQRGFVSAARGKTDELVSTLGNTFTRLTLVRNDRPERLTIDLELEFTSFGPGKANDANLEGVVVAEVKQSRADRTSPFVKKMRELGHRPSGMSKYCIGLLKLEKAPKHNKFKEVLRRLDHIASLA